MIRKRVVVQVYFENKGGKKDGKCADNSLLLSSYNAKQVFIYNLKFDSKWCTHHIHTHTHIDILLSETLEWFRKRNRNVESLEMEFLLFFRNHSSSKIFITYLFSNGLKSK